MLCNIITPSTDQGHPMKASAFSPHDHSRCITSAIGHAKSLCADRGVKLTPVRQRVLELVWQSHQPIGAYELLASLAKEGFNSAPPTVYRALEFLSGQGLLLTLMWAAVIQISHMKGIFCSAKIAIKPRS